MGLNGDRPAAVREYTREAAGSVPTLRGKALGEAAAPDGRHIGTLAYVDGAVPGRVDERASAGSAAGGVGFEVDAAGFVRGGQGPARPRQRAAPVRHDKPPAGKGVPLQR